MTVDKKLSDTARRPGRPKGAHNKITADIKALAQKYTAKAMAELGRLSLEAESETARVAAIKELFDRGYGKATQLLGSDPSNPLPTTMAVNLIRTTPLDDAG